ncbi:uncharacterized protein F4812DRAFT_359920 [Daldinia caldariorum]|uniref:uncharacterized protein n=1 Tax=Daldinia caldariorum TaxID=326644 RepID=UPI00200774EC|nr:uncharacterized protein F4812DRAFT_359920 [Daldinia caldariorum]KAI1468246.1 hypothetical protein F4812DRAFT_359920 [Daldinia caldariorum]
MASQSRSIFLSLPLEIREEIYLQLLGFRDDVEVKSLSPKLDRWINSIWHDSTHSDSCCDGDSNGSRGRTSILRVSRQVGGEALNVLYQRNTFAIHTHAECYDKLLKFGTANMRRIRSLRLVAHSHELGYMEPVKFDPRIWGPLLADLAHLSLVLQQPWKSRGYRDHNGFEEDLRKWRVWLEPILQYLASNIPENTAVSVDDNGSAETSDVVHRCFLSGYQRVQTKIGDEIFERVLPSDSDYWYDDYDMGSAYGGAVNWSD